MLTITAESLCHYTDLHLYDLLRSEAVSGGCPKCIDAAPQEVAPHPYTEALTMYDGEPSLYYPCNFY